MPFRAHRRLSTLGPASLWLLALWVMFGRYFVVSINLTESLPGKLYLIQKGVKPGLNDFAAFNALYGRYLGANPAPRSTVQVARLPMGCLVEVECIALV